MCNLTYLLINKTTAVPAAAARFELDCIGYYK